MRFDLSDFSEMFVALMRAEGLDEALQVVLNTFCCLLGVDKGAILLVDEQTQELVTRASVGLTRAVKLGSYLDDLLVMKEIFPFIR